MGVHRRLLAGSLRCSSGSDKDSSQKLTDLFAIVNTFGSSLFSVGSMLGGFGLLSATLRLFKVESDINGILPAGGGPLPFISFLA
jgi:hypothetical protein